MDEALDAFAAWVDGIIRLGSQTSSLRTQGPITAAVILMPGAAALPLNPLHMPRLWVPVALRLPGRRVIDCAARDTGYDASMAKILIVNPNTTASMTETIGAAARAVAAPGTEISGRHVVDGAGLDRGLLRRGLRRARPDPGAMACTPDADAAIVACFDDTGLDAARTAGALPGGRHLRGGAGDGGPDRKTHRHRHHAAALDRAAGGAGAPLWFCGEGAGHRLRRRGARSRKARLGRGSEAGGRDFRARSTRARRRSCWAARGWPISRTKLSRKFGVPVVDGVAAAVKQAEALAGLKLTTSRRGSYASPGAKAYTGILRTVRAGKLQADCGAP